MKVSYKSQIDYGDLFSLTGTLGIFVWFGFTSSESALMKSIVISVAIILLYLLLQSTVYLFLFDEDKIRIVHYCRFFNREKVVLYSDIDEVRYLNNTGYRLPTIVFVYNGQKFSRLFKSSNSFTHRRFSKRKNILLFLHEKGIPIYIESWKKKDIEIFGKSDNVTYSDRF